MGSILSGCSLKKADAKYESLYNSFEKKYTEISILMPYEYYANNGSYIKGPLNKLAAFLQSYGRTVFKVKRDIMVRIVDIPAENRDDFYKARNTLLHSDNGPTLIFINKNNESIDTYIDQGIAMDIHDKIPNSDELYEPLKNDYFVPIGMYVYGLILKKDKLDDIGVDYPDIDWTMKDYKAIREKWFEKYSLNMNSQEFYNLFSFHMLDFSVLDDEGNVSIYNQKAIDTIKDIRDEIYSDRYILNEKYTLENYQKMLFDWESSESQASWGYNKINNEEKWINTAFQTNIIHPIQMYYNTVCQDVKLVSDVTRGNEQVLELGFVVNYNGENVEEGLEYLNALLGKEGQIALYRNKNFRELAPVNKNIEKEIDEINVSNAARNNLIPDEIYELKNYALEKVKDGTYQTYNIDQNETFIYWQFYRKVAEIVFADYFYTDEEIAKELKKLESKIFIYMNE